MTIQKDPRNDADVNTLLKLFPDILPDGRVITHEQLETALHMTRLSARYGTVITKWRRVLRDEKCIYLDGLAAQGAGFVSLTPDEMVRFGNRKVRAAGRQLKKALHVMTMPDDKALSEDTRRYRHVLAGAIERIAQENRAALRDVSRALAPVKQLPKRAAG
jgi:hypothetical protein